MQDKDNNEHDEIVSKISNTPIQTLMDKSNIKRLNDLYHSIEKPVEDLIHKVEDKLPNNVKAHSSLILSIFSIFSLSLIGLGIFSIFKSKKV